MPCKNSNFGVAGIAGARFAKWRPMPANAFERDERRSLTAEDEVILVTIPPEANEAA